MDAFLFTVTEYETMMIPKHPKSKQLVTEAIRDAKRLVRKENLARDARIPTL